MSFKKRLFKANIRIAIIPILTFLVLIVIATGVYRHISDESRRHTGMEISDPLFYAMLIIIFVVAILIFLCCTIYANRMVQQLMIPLCILCEGAKRIAEGDLENKLTYKGEEEFELVCDSFNEMQERLADNIKMNIELEQKKQEMIAGISHDLKTPLTAVKGYVRGILDGVANTEEKKQRYLEQIAVKADEMGALIDELFLYSKLETGKVVYTFTVCNINDYISEYCAAICEEYRDSGVHISCETDGCTETVNIDQDHMNRVLHNIISNSVKYNDADDLQIIITVHSGADSVNLLISDNGTGVPEDKLQCIFESFYRVDEARENPEKGSGLGLAIVKDIVEAHGGRVSARNSNGLVIEIILPRYSEFVAAKGECT